MVGLGRKQNNFKVLGVVVMENWREIPAATVEEIIFLHIGHFPPTMQELLDLLEKQRYSVRIAPAHSGEQAQSYHQSRRVVIPHGRPDRMLAMLLHETAEALLRLPLAPEFVHPLTGTDEFHAVAGLTVDRMFERLQAERCNLLEEEAVEEEAVASLCESIEHISTEVDRAIQAIRKGNWSTCMPDTTLIQTQTAALNLHTARLEAIHARLVHLTRSV
jgi:hypothetical protein